MDDYERSLKAANTEMAAADVLQNQTKPLLFRVQRFAGFEPRPPLYQEFWVIAIQTAISFGLIWASLAYFVFWRPTGNEVYKMFVGISIGMILYGLMLALLTTKRAKTIKLSDWNDL